MATVLLIPSFLAENANSTIPPYVIQAFKTCTVVFAENERTARRFLKQMDRDIVIDDYTWHSIGKAEEEVVAVFTNYVQQHKTIAIISEAGCPGVADPGQMLVAAAQQLGATIKPFVGPNSILLALMASGMNGQHFEFIGYLPIDAQERKQKILLLEQQSLKDGSTKIFIETPYRNNQLINTIMQTCTGSTKFCIAYNLTSATEKIETKTIAVWKKALPTLEKEPTIFLLNAKN
jgi:16S rRNA (cytidine1402-2'-O)-methyltransferase